MLAVICRFDPAIQNQVIHACLHTARVLRWKADWKKQGCSPFRHMVSGWLTLIVLLFSASDFQLLKTPEL
jgi:hypothetical protein